jgi:kynurenine formamidase
VALRSRINTVVARELAYRARTSPEDHMLRADADYLAALFEKVKNWGRWGPDDEAGALNLLTPHRVARAAELAQTGRTVSLSRDLDTGLPPGAPFPVQHFMLKAGDAMGEGFQDTEDFLGIACHGLGISHVDALCHVFVNDQMYNGRPPSEVASTGAARNAIHVAAQAGVVGRGVLIDLPLFRGVDYLEPGEAVEVEELERALAHQLVRALPGDILLVSHGRDARRKARGEWNPGLDGLSGLHPHCLEWLRSNDIAVLGADGIQDPIPANAVEAWPFPIHQVGIAAIGLHLIDNLDLSRLAETCRELNRFEFLFMAGPLRARAATGSPVNPIAVL